MNRSLYVSHANDLHSAWEMHNGAFNGYNQQTNWETQQQMIQEPPAVHPSFDTNKAQQLAQQQTVAYGGYPSHTQYILQGPNTAFLHGCVNTDTPQNAAVYSGTGSVLYGETRGLLQRGLVGFLESHQTQSTHIQSFVDPKQYQVKSEDLYGRIGLNLGVRTYFSSEDALMRLSKRSRVEAPVVQVPLCQAEGCKADLSSAKHYHRRHKVCELHSKAATVTANGQTQRFCQQCSRFHPLGEFDEGKRSCRKRLADHNRRRRKPQPAVSSEPKEGENDGAHEEEKPVPGSPASCSDSKSDDVSQQRASCTRTEENGAHSTLLADKVTSSEDKTKNALTNGKYGLTENVDGTDRSSNVKGTDENYLRLSSEITPWSKPEAAVQVASASVQGLATCRPYLAPQPYDCNNTADSMGNYGAVYGVTDRELS